MNADTAEIYTSNYLPALTAIVECLIKVLPQINETTINPQSFLAEPKGYIYFYYGWLEFVINHKIIGDTKNLLNLIRETIQKHLEQGKALFKVVNIYTGKEAQQIDQFVASNGVIVGPILKFIQFISNQINQNLNKRSSSSMELNIKLFDQEMFIDIFESIFQNAIQDVNNLQIPNPLIFVLEHLSVMLGWTIGFFCELTKKPVHSLLDANDFAWLN